MSLRGSSCCKAVPGTARCCACTSNRKRLSKPSPRPQGHKCLTKLTWSTHQDGLGGFLARAQLVGPVHGLHEVRPKVGGGAERPECRVVRARRRDDHRHVDVGAALWIPRHRSRRGYRPAAQGERFACLLLSWARSSMGAAASLSACGVGHCYAVMLLCNDAVPMPACGASYTRVQQLCRRCPHGTTCVSRLDTRFLRVHAAS